MANVIQPIFRVFQTYAVGTHTILINKDIAAALLTTLQVHLQDRTNDFSGQVQVWVSNAGGTTLNTYYPIQEYEVEDDARQALVATLNNGTENYNGCSFVALVLHVDSGTIFLNHIYMTCKL